AALEGARAGLRVTVVEQNSVPGGHAVISSGGLSLIATPLQKSLNIPDTPELAIQDFLRWGEDANEEWVRHYVNASKTEIYDWMTALGTEFTFASLNGAGNSVARFHSPRGQGLGLVIPVYREILRQGGVAFLLGTRVTAVRTSAEGRVTGVATENLRTGAKAELRGGAVVLSTGGYAAQLDLVRSAWPPFMRTPERVLAGGGFFAFGGGMDLAKQAGGVAIKLDHQWNYENGLPDPFDPEGKRGYFTNVQGGIWVNAQGKRFALEQHEPKAAVPAIAAQNPARYWTIFDAEGRKGFRVVHAGFGEDRVRELFEAPNFIHRADSIAQLAEKVGLPADVLQATIERYNSMVEAGEDKDFGRFGPSKKVAPGSFPAPPPRKIAAPPFYAAPNFILIRKSGGGIQVDLQTRVLKADGTPIPGLYAAGEATGFLQINGKHGMEGTFLGPCILMGRIAAQAAAAAITPARPKPAAPTREAIHTAPPAVAAKLATTCRGCHDLPKLVAAKRPGFWHFEQSHKLVISRQWNCTGCHGEMTPFRAASHKIDRELQTGVCQHCHMNASFPPRRAVPAAATPAAE
ncbi:MAG: FAD-binding protein, partial [Bryobacterales bacterium]|nr:FAD-binding protein [Bryobacterales bacterium]